MAKHGFPGFGANMSNLMKQAQKMQRDMENYKPNSGKEVEATAGGGAVR